MECPKCSADMDIVEFQGIEIDRCTRCKGIWFDYMEKERMLELSNAADIDVGDENIGSEYNEMVYVECPRCDAIMDQKEEFEPKHMKYEFCRSCHGMFFDAGEFRDLVTGQS